MAHHGVDISNHQITAARNLGRPIDWAAAARDGIRYAWYKATEGYTYRDPYLQAMATGLRSAGIPSGAYHFARPGDPVRQARWFVGYAAEVGAFDLGGLRPMLDVEDPGVGDGWIAAWIHECRRLTGVKRVVVYASRHYYTHLLHVDRWADDDTLLWVADYNGQPGLLTWNHPRLALHQHTSEGNVAGFPGHVDKNVTVNAYNVADLLINSAAGTPGGGSTGEGGFLMALAEWEQRRIFDRVLSMSAGVEGQNHNGDQFSLEQNRMTEVLAKLDALTAAVAALANDADLTVDQVRAIINDAVAQNVTIEGSVRITGTPASADDGNG